MIKTVSVQINVPKEFYDVALLLEGLIVKLKAKLDITEYSDLLDELMAAIEGIGGIGDEAKSKYRSDAIAYISKVLMDSLMPVEEEEVEVPVV